MLKSNDLQNDRRTLLNTGASATKSLLSQESLFLAFFSNESKEWFLLLLFSSTITSREWRTTERRTQTIMRRDVSAKTRKKITNRSVERTLSLSWFTVAVVILAYFLKWLTGIGQVKLDCQFTKTGVTTVNVCVNGPRISGFRLHSETHLYSDNLASSSTFHSKNAVSYYGPYVTL